ncbi:hypothetical protein PINS_up015041 [Pythium insidiosum]|nr:hypothetical protein PINS_up015041 [Pythium insidiosum]
MRPGDDDSLSSSLSLSTSLLEDDDDEEEFMNWPSTEEEEDENEEREQSDDEPRTERAFSVGRCREDPRDYDKTEARRSAIRCEEEKTEQENDDVGEMPVRLVARRSSARDSSGTEIADASETHRHAHYTACFVRVDPPTLRGLTSLELSGLELQPSDLGVLTANLFLLERMQSLDLSNNHLDDSCTKELRAFFYSLSLSFISLMPDSIDVDQILNHSTLRRLDLSRNLLGRGAAKAIAERLSHSSALQEFDLHGNPYFFAFDDASDVARALAQGIFASTSLLCVRLSLSEWRAQLHRERLLTTAKEALVSSEPRKSARASLSRTQDAGATPAEAFTRELVELTQRHDDDNNFRHRARQQRPRLHTLALVQAELTRQAVVNVMKLSSALVSLDLSFAFVGVAGAKVIAAALRMPSFATLSTLRLDTKPRDHNGIERDARPALLALLQRNRTLVRLDLSRNDVFSRALTASAPCSPTRQREPTKAKLKDADVDVDVVDAVRRHPALRSLGDLARVGASSSLQKTLSDHLVQREREDNELILQTMERPQRIVDGGGDENDETHERAARTTSNAVAQVSAVQLSWDTHKHKMWHTLWTSSQAIARQARVSLLWRMRATAVESSRALPRHAIQWRVVVHRVCELKRHIVDDDVACGRLELTSKDASEPTMTLLSALLYCEEGDRVSLCVQLTYHNDGDDASNEHDDSSLRVTPVRVVVKDMVVLQHDVRDRHIGFALDAPARVEWQVPRLRRCHGVGAFSHVAWLHRTYIPQTHRYRFVWRVRLPVASSRASVCDALDALHWRLTRRGVWQGALSLLDAEEDVVIEGASRDWKAVDRDQRDVIVASTAVELVAGDEVQLHAATNASSPPELELVQLFVLYEV